MTESINLNSEVGTCKCCGKKFEGRLGQKFYNQLHKSRFHNRQRQQLVAETKTDFGIILRNRAILQEMSQRHGKNAFPASELFSKGYSKNYVTRIEDGKPHVCEYVITQQGNNIQVDKVNAKP